VQSLLARVIGLLGPIPTHMQRGGKEVEKYFTGNGMLYQRVEERQEVMLMQPKRTTLAHRLHSDDAEFVDFVTKLLDIDPDNR
jgi:hypothetical protein